MTRRIIAVALVVLGLIAILAAIASATLWRPTDTETLTMPARPDAAVVISDPGVLDAVADEVTITATADAEESVTLVVARTEDVTAWLGDSAHARITGLASWDELEVAESGPTEEPADTATDEGTDAPTAEEPTAAETATEPAEEAPTGVPNPAGSDMWVVEQTGNGSAEIEWEAVEGRWSLLAATDGTAPAPTVALAWPVDVRTPWLIPGAVGGAVLLLAGLALLTLELLTARETRRRRAVATERTARREENDAAETTVMAPVAGAADGTGLTRRQLREQQRTGSHRGGRSGAATDEVPGGGEQTADVRSAGAARGAGVVPGSSSADELRAGRDEETPPAYRPGGDEPPTSTTSGSGERDTEAAGVARGAGIVPAATRAAEHRTGRDDVTEASGAAQTPEAEQEAAVTPEAEHDAATSSPVVRDTNGTTDEDAVWTADAAGLDERAAAPPDDGADVVPTGGDDEEASSWRDVWGFADRDRGTDETENPR